MNQDLLYKLIEKNFIFVASPINSKIINKFSQTNSEQKVFMLEKEKPFFIEQTTEEDTYHCIPCAVVSITDSITIILTELTRYPYVLFTNLDSEYIGYTTYHSFYHKLLCEYEQMDAYLNAILNTIEGSCIVINQQQDVLYWTYGAEKIFSLEKQEIVGKPITDFFSTDRLEILNTLKGTSVHQLQHHAREDLVVLINSNPVYDQDEIIGAVVFETDITNQIRLNNKLYATSEKLFNLEKEVRKSQDTPDPFAQVKGGSPALVKTIELAKKAAATDASILIYGESGVGKELFAKSIHDTRENENAPFVAINCGAIPNSLFESEIFGYEKGAFSGANQKGKKGKVELANKGTLFLDEIGEMPLEMQVKFLRILQEKKFYPVGGTKEIEVDFRIMAATNRDLKELVAEGKFREDLYYRLNVVNIVVPPLRERFEDIIELTHYFLYEISIKYNRPIHGISKDVMEAILHYSWPGNIRELKNTIERLVVFSENGNIKLEDLPFETEKGTVTNHIIGGRMSLSERLQEHEKDIILTELKKVNGNKIACAKNLDISRATLYNRMNKLGIKT